MQVTSTEELNIKGKECNIVSNSYHSLKHLRSTKVLAVHEREEVDKCNHFTIRGFVASVRKRDPDICWPLCIPDSQTVHSLANSLPPLVVSRSKQWNCMNCVQSISSSRDEIGNAATSNVKGNKAKANDFSTDATNSFSCFQQTSDGKTLRQRVAEVDSSVNVSHGESSSGPSSMQKDIQSSIKDMEKEVPRNDCHQFEGRGTQSTHTAILAEEGETLAKREKQLRKGPEGTFVSNNTSVLVTAKINERELVSRSPTAKICDRITSSVRNIVAEASNTGNTGSNSEGRSKFVDNCVTEDQIGIVKLNNYIPENTTSITVGASGSNDNLMDLDEKNDDAGMVMSDVETNHNFSELCSYDGKENKKLSQKSRSLVEIMRTEDSNIPKKLSNTKNPKEVSQMKPSHDIPHRLVAELQHSTCPSHLIGRRTEVTLNRAISELNDHEKGKEPSLMQWLRKASRKGTTNKLNGRTKRMRKKIAVSSGIPVRKSPDLQIRCSAEIRQPNSMVEKESKGPHAVAEVLCPITHHDKSVSKDDTMKSIPSSIIQPKIGTQGSNTILHRDLGFPDKTLNTKFLKRKRGRPRAAERVSRQMDQSGNETLKKQKTKSSSDQEIIGDIPMDIVELLAKNQNERTRSLMHAKAVADNSPGLSTGNCNTMFENVSCVSGSLGSKVQSAAQTKNLSFGTGEYDQTVLAGNQNFQGQKFGTCNCSVYRKNNLNIDLNQQDPDFMESSECAEYQPFNNHLHVTDSPLCSAREKINVQEINIHPRNQELPCQSFCRNYPMAPSILPAEIVTGGNMKVGGFRHDTVNVDYYDPYSRRHLMALPNKNDYNERSNTSGSQFLTARGIAEQSTNLAALPPLFMIQEQNACHFRRLETSDLGTDDTMSATHLLRLVDHAAITGSSRPSSSRHVQNGELHFNSQPSWLEASVRNGQEFQSSSRTGYFIEDRTPGSSYKLHRPIPRIGVLGPLLQKEILTHCDSNRMQLGCEAKCSHLLSGCTRVGAYDMGTSSKLNSSIFMGNQNGFTQNFPLHSCSSSICEMSKARLMNMDGVQPVRRSFRTEACVVNRNPADFTAPDEDNIYMR